MTRIGLYLRLSDDREGTQAAIARQREDCERYAAARDWRIADVFTDNDVSAYQRRARRPEFERMLAAVEGKAVDGVLTWKMDRITRRQRDLVRLDEACEDAGGFIASVVEGIDTREPSGRFVAELMVSQARMESENQSIRVHRKHRERAEAGKAHGGGNRPFGYTMDRSQVIPAEAALVREAASRILAGEGITSVLRDWERRGVTTPTGRTWQRRSLRSMLRRASLAGMREYEGRLYPATWPAILSMDDVRRLRAVFEGRKGERAPRRYLLGGIVRCGRCGARMSPRPTADGTRRYVCVKLPGEPGCGRVARDAEKVEAHVRDSVLAALAGVDLGQYARRDERPDEGALLDAIRADEAAMEELSRDYYVERRISRAEYATARGALAARLEESNRALAQQSGTDFLANVIDAGEVTAARWEREGLDWRRSVVKALIERIVILPARSGPRFDPEKVQIIWRV